MNPPTMTARDIRFSTATAPEAAAGLDTLLTDLVTFVRRYVVVTDHQLVAIVLWAAHTHAIEAADCTPYLQITSATKRAGKTRLLEVLEPIVARPWLTGRTSAAALVRKVDAQKPTLLLDESDAAFRGEKEYADALRGILNTGYRRSGKYTVCIGQGTNITARDFATFSAKAIAGIGTLPDTVGDRSIATQLRRRTTDEPCDRWRERDGHQQAAPLHEQLSSWAARAVETLRDARPALPPSLGDRQADVWEPLLAIADLAGGSWPTRARSAAIALAGSVEDQDIIVELLQDVSEIIADYSNPIIRTKELIEKLVEQEDRPWATWSKGKPLTAHKLARLLRPLDVHVVETMRWNGYRVDAFTDAITRYLSSQTPYVHSANENGPESLFSKLQEDRPSGASGNSKTPTNTGASGGMELPTPDTGDRADTRRDRWAGRLPGPGDPPNGISREAWERHHGGARWNREGI